MHLINILQNEKEMTLMKNRFLIMLWCVAISTLFACNSKNHDSTKRPKAVSNVVMTITEATNKPATNNQKYGTQLEKRLDNETTLACQFSYNTTAQAVKMQASSNQPQHLPHIELANYDIFMGDCLRLPRMVQKCLVDEYAFQHMKTCQHARTKYDASVKTAHHKIND